VRSETGSGRPVELAVARLWAPRSLNRHEIAARAASTNAVPLVRGSHVHRPGDPRPHLGHHRGRALASTGGRLRESSGPRDEARTPLTATCERGCRAPRGPPRSPPSGSPRTRQRQLPGGSLPRPTGRSPTHRKGRAVSTSAGGRSRRSPASSASRSSVDVLSPPTRPGEQEDHAHGERRLHRGSRRQGSVLAAPSRGSDRRLWWR
jgi:hypothetical protein